MSWSHATTLLSGDGRQSSELTDNYGPYNQQVERGLSLMSDENWFGFSLWKIPEGARFGDLDFREYPIEYLQSAGDAGAMSIEIRRVETDGEPHQYAVAKGRVQSGEPERRITYGSQELYVHDNEVFTADEATPIYVHYFETGELPAGVGLRELEL